VTARAASLGDVSRETRARLDLIAQQLIKWQPHINLVSSTTLGELETRHFIDSLQLFALASDAQSWIDLGSGGGFPGLVVAAAMAERSDRTMVLVESNAKKCAFLRETARVARLPVTVLAGRIETVVPGLGRRFDVVSARALAPLDRLLDYAEPLLLTGSIGLFPKGQDVDEEIAVAERAWILGCDLIQSQTEEKARIVRVHSAVRRET
jgi:16S rRNA (guanine527-N7)-methyltransferase